METGSCPVPRTVASSSGIQELATPNSCYRVTRTPLSPLHQAQLGDLSLLAPVTCVLESGATRISRYLIVTSNALIMLIRRIANKIGMLDLIRWIGIANGREGSLINWAVHTLQLGQLGDIRRNRRKSGDQECFFSLLSAGHT